MPAIPPVTIPVNDPIEATLGVLLLQVPPPGLSLSDVVKPEHKVPTPLIATGKEFTVTTEVVIQPVGKE